MLALAGISFGSSLVACSLWSTTAQGRINARHGTVNDLQAMQRSAKAMQRKSM